MDSVWKEVSWSEIWEVAKNVSLFTHERKNPLCIWVINLSYWLGWTSNQKSEIVIHVPFETHPSSEWGKKHLQSFSHQLFWCAANLWWDVCPCSTEISSILIASVANGPTGMSAVLKRQQATVDTCWYNPVFRLGSGLHPRLTTSTERCIAIGPARQPKFPDSMESVKKRWVPVRATRKPVLGKF